MDYKLTSLFPICWNNIYGFFLRQMSTMWSDLRRFTAEDQLHLFLFVVLQQGHHEHVLESTGCSGGEEFFGFVHGVQILYVEIVPLGVIGHDVCIVTN